MVVRRLDREAAELLPRVDFSAVVGVAAGVDRPEARLPAARCEEAARDREEEVDDRRVPALARPRLEVDLDLALSVIEHERVQLSRLFEYVLTLAA
ncbi:MAG TPA: hypothetical protein VKX39_15355 [Bryobacteraceae bacterium]|nr:hypothetical protein [Bryobacteraceae bacterium]